MMETTKVQDDIATFTAKVIAIRATNASDRAALNSTLLHLRSKIAERTAQFKAKQATKTTVAAMPVAGATK